jgi:hypothetical protein
MKLRSIAFGLLGCVLSLASAHAQAAGWNVLRDTYMRPSLVDGFTFEWQYFMVHDAKQQFTGSIGYVLVDPRGRLGWVDADGLTDLWQGGLFPLSVMPSGASVALAGTWADGTQFANYERFAQNYAVGIQDKNFTADPNAEGYFAQLLERESVRGDAGVFQLKGQTADAAWDLTVTPEALFESGPEEYTTVRGFDVGFVPGEHWNVHMEWPRTRVVGTIRNLKTGKSYPIDGHGYRENSWGRWNFAVDGWVFSVVSDRKQKVQWAWQTYHKSKDMDWLDVSFEDQGQPVTRRFFAKQDQLRWKLGEWFFHKEARQCVPNTVDVVAEDGDYRVRATYDLTGRQLPMLSTATALTQIFVIMIHMPYIKGVIENVKTGEVVTRFEGQGGGEFSTTRSLWQNLPETNCERWGRRFNTEYSALPFLD